MTKKQKKTLQRILISGCLYIILLLASHLSPAFASFPQPVAFILFAIPYGIIGYDIIIKAFKNIRNGQIFDENFLMMVATFAAFAIGEYSESVAVMLFYQVGELFQSYAVGKSRQSIADMMSIAPEVAFVEKDGEITEVDPEDVVIGDRLVIRSGEKIPLDGIIAEGTSYIDTSALTGESVPRKVTVGDAVISGCVNGSDTLYMNATKVYEDSTVARILELVENASEKKAHLENFITRFARYYTPVVTIGAAILAILPPILLGQPFAGWIRRACIFLIVSCPCALVISVPLGFFGGIGAASKKGILVKGSNYLELLANMRTIVFDKTGTLTKGEFTVTKTISHNPRFLAADLLNLAAHVESFSTHPIARSICAANKETIHPEFVSDMHEVSGKGLSCKYKGKTVLIGNRTLLTDAGIDTPVSDEDGTIIYIAHDNVYAGVIVIDDRLKEGTAAAIKELISVGVTDTVMLTGNREATAKRIAAAVGLHRYFAELLPEDKVNRLEDIMAKTDGTVAFVGDGINDAPVLMRADIGIAMGSLGSDAAIEAADIVIMDDDLRKLPAATVIARKTITIVRENIVFALGIKLLILILGALGHATMWAAVFADVGVAVLAILNSMRTLKTKK